MSVGGIGKSQIPLLSVQNTHTLTRSHTCLLIYALTHTLAHTYVLAHILEQTSILVEKERERESEG